MDQRWFHLWRNFSSDRSVGQARTWEGRRVLFARKWWDASWTSWRISQLITMIKVSENRQDQNDWRNEFEFFSRKKKKLTHKLRRRNEGVDVDDDVGEERMRHSHSFPPDPSLPSFFFLPSWYIHLSGSLRLLQPAASSCNRREHTRTDARRRTEHSESWRIVGCSLNGMQLGVLPVWYTFSWCKFYFPFRLLMMKIRNIFIEME